MNDAKDQKGLRQDESDESIIVGRNIASEAEDLLASAYEVDSSVDGILKCVDVRGKLQFVIYDILDDHAIKCGINSKNLLDQALSSFKKRVEVIGVVRYRKDGVPVGVTANKIINYPDKSQIPSLEQIRILLSNNTPI